MENSRSSEAANDFWNAKEILDTMTVHGFVVYINGNGDGTYTSCAVKLEDGKTGKPSQIATGTYLEAAQAANQAALDGKLFQYNALGPVLLSTDVEQAA